MSYYSAGVGVWESTGPRSAHFTAVQAITGADIAFGQVFRALEAIAIGARN